MTQPTSPLVPCLPESAPFSAEQRAYLNGFLAGLFSRTQAMANAPAPQAQPTLTPLTILFGSQTGTSEMLAKRVLKTASQRGFAPTICDMAQYDRGNLTRETNLLIITSTYGDGEPPDSAKALHEALRKEDAAKLPGLKYSVCALGDTNYAKFCQCGKDFDERLEALSAKRLFARVDCDVDYEEPFSKWLDGTLTAFSAENPVKPTEVVVTEAATPAPEATVAYSRSNPFPAPLKTNRLLNAAGSAKEVRHFEFVLEGSGLNYEAGDALAVIPVNCAEQVAELITSLNVAPETPVTGSDGKQKPLHEALRTDFEITKIPKSLIKLYADATGADELKALSAENANGELSKYLLGRELIDLTSAFPAKLPVEHFLKTLRKLPPRLYSISSSPKLHPGEVHLTVGIVRYETHGRKRKGVCSTYLADRAGSDSRVRVYIQPSKHFHPPANPDAPMIMVGPGTGIAPFRAFLEDRLATGAKGKNWLFFGDQRASSDFLYREELEIMQSKGVLHKLDTAFSRDQEQKVYVQHRMLEQAKDLYAWLEEGASFYVCGDASRMAKDVDAALHEVIRTAGGKSPEQAAEYIAKLKSEKRYERDVY